MSTKRKFPKVKPDKNDMEDTELQKKYFTAVAFNHGTDDELNSLLEDALGGPDKGIPDT